MICPVCKSQYRDGYTRCADCDVDLVGSLQPTADAGEHDPFVRVCSARGDGELGSVRSTLDSEGIPYRVLANAESLMGFIGRVERYTILVPPSQVEAAHKALGLHSPSNSEEDSSDKASAPIDAVDGDEYALSDETGADEGIGPVDPDSWNPDDATSKVWSGIDGSAADMIVASLRENGIHWRAEDGTQPAGDGTDRIIADENTVVAEGQPITVFVLPEDEHRAKEIIREITASEPL